MGFEGPPKKGQKQVKSTLCVCVCVLANLNLFQGDPKPYFELLFSYFNVWRSRGAVAHSVRHEPA